MDEHFWQVIDEARHGHPTSDERMTSIRGQLMNRDLHVLAAFRAATLGWWVALDRRDLWAAAYALLGGCGDDSFMDFRTWLLLHGRDAIEKVVRDPDGLVEWKYLESPGVEGLLAIPEQLAGVALPELDFHPDVSAWPADRVTSHDWTDEDCDRWYPRISADPLWKRRSRPRPKKPSAWVEAWRIAADDPVAYSRDAHHAAGTKLRHPSYGVGVVTTVRGDRIDVMFPDEKLRVFLHRAH
jgi:hypothetical protein